MQGNSALPAGWEAKWDPNAQRVYFVNHITHTTQWDPPIPPPSAPEWQPPQAQQTHVPTSATPQLPQHELYGQLTALAEQRCSSRLVMQRAPLAQQQSRQRSSHCIGAARTARRVLMQLHRSPVQPLSACGCTADTCSACAYFQSARVTRCAAGRSLSRGSARCSWCILWCNCAERVAPRVAMKLAPLTVERCVMHPRRAEAQVVMEWCWMRRSRIVALQKCRLH